MDSLRRPRHVRAGVRSSECAHRCQGLRESPSPEGSGPPRLGLAPGEGTPELPLSPRADVLGRQRVKQDKGHTVLSAALGSNNLKTANDASVHELPTRQQVVKIVQSRP